MTERLHFHFSLSCIGEGNGNPLQCSCLENPREGGAWWAAVYGVAQSWTQLKRLSSSSSSTLSNCSTELAYPSFSFAKLKSWWLCALFVCSLYLSVIVAVQSLSHVQLFCNPMDCSPPGSSVTQAKILEWVAISFSRGSSQLKGLNPCLLLGRQFFTTELPGKPLCIIMAGIFPCFKGHNHNFYKSIHHHIVDPNLVIHFPFTNSG